MADIAFDNIVKRVKSYILAKNYSKALKLCEKYKESKIGTIYHDKINIPIAGIYECMEEYNIAIQIYLDIIHYKIIKPIEFGHIMCKLANNYNMILNYEEALKYYKKADIIFSSKHMFLSACDDKTPNKTMCKDCYLLMVESHTTALGCIGTMLHKLERYDEAIISFKKSIDIDRYNKLPETATTITVCSLLNSLFKLNKFSDMLKYIDDSILNLNISNTFIYNQLLLLKCHALYNCEYYEDTVDICDMILKNISEIANDKYFQVLYNKCLSLYKLNRYNEAIVSIDQAIKIKSLESLIDLREQVNAKIVC